MNISRKCINNLLSKNGITPSIRNFYYFKNYDDTYSIGLTNDIISIYKRINNIKITEKKFLIKGTELFNIETPEFNESITSPFDCKIIERNYNAINTINFFPENKKSWIVKIKPITTTKNYVYLENIYEKCNFYNKDNVHVPIFYFFFR